MFNNFTMIRVQVTFAFGLFGLWLSGCANWGVPAGAERVDSPERYSLLFDVSEHVLKSYQFKIDRADRRLGRISTNLETGKSFFEFWRKDTSSAAKTVESSLGSIYHSAIVSFQPLEQENKGWDVAVEVNVYRPKDQTVTVTGVSQAYAMYNRSRGSRKQRLEESPEALDVLDVELVAQDEQFAMKIRNEIMAKLESLLGDKL